MVFINGTGIVVIWGKTSNKDVKCCDSCEKFASCAGWILYLIFTIIMFLFTCILCAFVTFLLIKNDPNNACPGIVFDDTTKCTTEICTDGHGGAMKIQDCPMD